MNKDFEEGIKVFDEAIKELEAQMEDGVCKNCAIDGGKLWPEDTKKYLSAPCHSCGEETDTIIIPWSELEDAA